LQNASHILTDLSATPAESNGSKPFVHTIAPRRVTQADLAEQVFTVAVELDRRAALKRERDRRYRARRKAEQRKRPMEPVEFRWSTPAT
jgi:hypothetical protein